MKTCVQKMLSATLIGVLINTLWFPSALLVLPFPAQARDTDIYAASTVGSEEPVVMLMLDTSDSMNLPEAWREYPGAYDSHVEYLWNNNVYISQISTNSPPPAAHQGGFAGSTPAIRAALKNAAYNYAMGKEGSDPDKRIYYRNYGFNTGLYWLPAGTPESDPRLWSPSNHRFFGLNTQINTIRGGITFPSGDNSLPYNMCVIARETLTPSTVYAPTSHPKNAGKYLNDEWLRWNPFRALEVRNLAYYYGNYELGHRDDQRLPVRVQQAGSHAGWEDVQPDMGGNIFAAHWQAQPSAVRDKVFETIHGIYGTGADVTKALKGNRDSEPDPFKRTGTPGYIDKPALFSGNSNSPFCSWSGQQNDGADATGVVRFYGGTCAVTNAGQAANATCGVFPNGNDKFYTAYYQSCAWSGRQRLVVEGQTYYHGGTCQGLCRGENCLSTGLSTTNCNKSVNYPTLTLNGRTYYDVSLSAGGCDDKSPRKLTCSQKHGGAACAYGEGCGVVTSDVEVYKRSDYAEKFVHDCRGDETITASYMKKTPSLLTELWSSASYTNNATQAAPARGRIDVYHPNYLNWKFGPKGPNNHPIGRKTRLQTAKDVLIDLIQNTNGVRFGLMVFNKTPANLTSNFSQGSQGGHIRYKVTRMGTSSADPDFVNRQALINIVQNLSANAQTPLTETLYEAYRYFSGLPPVFGTLNTAASGGGTVSEGYDSSAVVDGRYASPLVSAAVGCGVASKGYIIYVSDGSPERDLGADSEITTLLGTTNQAIDPLTRKPYGPADLSNSTKYVWLDELATYMSQADLNPNAVGTQSVATYTVGFAGGNTDLLKRTAIASGGVNYDATDASQLAQALRSAVRAIKSWNPTVGPSIPIDNNARTQSGDAAFIGFFEPNVSGTWLGTLKKWRIVTQGCPNNAAICLADQNGVPAEEVSIDGRQTLRNTARSLWSSVNDGGHPTKGGTGERLIAGNPSARNLYTYIKGVTGVEIKNNPVKPNASYLSKTLLGDAAMSDDERVRRINYARGTDPDDATEWRNWAHPAVLHSIPTVVDYGKTQYIYYMSVDGVLHAVDNATGDEAWGFMVEEAFPRIANFMSNPGGAEIIGGDGTPVYYHDKASGKKYLYFGLRRGGRAYYALDITDKNRPILAWKISHTSPGFSDLGQSWSVPVVGKVASGSSARSVVVFGGGYDPVEDNVAPTSNTMGRGLFIVDAANGTLIKAWGTANGMNDSVPSDPAALNVDLDAGGLLDRIYIGDLGGNVWRFDIANKDSTAWTIHKLAALGNYKILFPPAVVKQQHRYVAEGAAQRFDAVYVGTGDRERPLDASSRNIFVMLKDFDTNSTVKERTITPGDLEDVTSQVTAGSTTVQANLASKKGWLVNFDTGEKVINIPRVFFNMISVGTYAANANDACASLSRLYVFNALDATARPDSGTRLLTDVAGQGYLSSAQLFVKGRKIYGINMVDENFHAMEAATASSTQKVPKPGVGQKSFFYQERKR